MLKGMVRIVDSLTILTIPTILNYMLRGKVRIVNSLTIPTIPTIPNYIYPLYIEVPSFL
jgi:hypothetical protein